MWSVRMNNRRQVQQERGCEKHVVCDTGFESVSVMYCGRAPCFPSHSARNESITDLGSRGKRRGRPEEPEEPDDGRAENQSKHLLWSHHYRLSVPRYRTRRGGLDNCAGINACLKCMVLFVLLLSITTMLVYAVVLLFAFFFFCL